MRRQFYELKPGETLQIGDSRITLEAKTGQRARLKVESNLPLAKARSEPAVARPFTASPAEASPSAPAFLPRPKLG